MDKTLRLTDKTLRLTDRLVDISFCGLSASLYRAHTVQLTAILEDMEDFSCTLFYRRFSRQNKLLFHLYLVTLDKIANFL